jgi:ribosomal-protein-alanine N-acetyltransferase
VSAILRPARAADAEAIAALLASSLPDPWSAATIAESLAHGCRGLVAEEESAVTGVVLLQLASVEAEILQVAVTPSRRRAGTGRLLVRAALGLAAARGAEAVFLEVRPHNAAAIALYRAEGFVEAGLRPRYYANGDDALILRRDLHYPLPPPPNAVR